MVFDRTENEPEEWDPEEEYYDPDSDGLTIPQVSGDDGPDDLDDLSSAIEPPEVEMGETDASADLLQTFWALVLVLNAAVLAVSLGSLMLVFEGGSTHAVALVVAGVVLFGFAVRRYRRFRDGADEPDEADPDPSSDSDGGESGAAVEADGQPAETASDDAAETTSGSVTQRQSPNGNDRS
ncbi:DUF7322 domain-containing protein [Natrinema pellirubrum]|uniref:DUF7322 domain-containing protein n=1 Tax=Natrinema pellirubrum TaxID=69525 RepID=UPI000A6ABEB0|nr:hypothetical protein [Natrinema pellirubrum]